MDGKRANVLEDQLNDNLVELESRNMQLSYLRSSDVESCDVLKEGLQNILDDYNSRLEKVKRYQDDTFLKKERFKTINRRYVLSGIRYWIFANELRSKCQYQADTVLFFTKSIGADSCPDCRKQGTELSLLKDEYESQILIFSVPTNLEDGMIDILIKQYNVTEFPSVLLNANRTMKGYHSRSEIKRALNLSES